MSKKGIKSEIINPVITSGLEIGNIRVLRLADERKNGTNMWVYLCLLCNKELTTREGNLCTNRGFGCISCFNITRNKQRTIHGLAGTKEYNSWKDAIDRCYNPKDKSYKTYGKRGIKVCERWLEKPLGCLNFYNDMGPRPLGKTLNRIDNDKDYTPTNCNWVNASEQARNRTTTRYITVDGVTKCLVVWAEISGTKRATIETRLSRGWTAKEAVFGKDKILMKDLTSGEEN